MCIYQKRTLIGYEELFKTHNLKILRGEQKRSGSHITGNWTLQGPEKEHEELTEHLLNDAEILEFDF